MREAARDRRHGGFALPAALAAGVLILMAGALGAQVTGAGRRNVEVVRARRWVRMASASAFEEACARLTIWSNGVVPPLVEAKSGVRDLADVVAGKWPTSLDVPLARRTFDPESVLVGDVDFLTGPWTVQCSTGAESKVRELGIVTLNVVIRVKRPGQVVSRRVTVQRYATAVPMPDGSGFKVVVSPFDLAREEVEVRG